MPVLGNISLRACILGGIFEDVVRYGLNIGE